MEYRKDVQGLRAIALVLVLLAHWDVPYMGFGYIGVDIFFVISGYVITGVLMSRSPSSDFISFYAGRFKRLLPALFVMLIVVSIISFFINPPSFQIPNIFEGSAAALWMSNIHYAFSGQSYFDGGQPSLFLHTWSLGVEEQFYLIWPFVVLCIIKYKNSSLIITASIFFISLMMACYFLMTSPTQSYYMMPFRMWQFSAGAMVFLLSLKIDLTLRKKGVVWCELILLLTAILFFYALKNYLVVNTLFLVILFAFILFVGGYKSGFLFKVLESKLLVWMGDRSYSIYLWHWPIWVLLSSLGVFSGANLLFITAIIVLLIGDFSYRYVENPVRKNEFLSNYTRATLYGSILITGLTVFGGTIAIKNLRQIVENNGVSELYKINYDMSPLYRDGCDDWYKSSIVKPCIYQVSSNSDRTIVLIGDSVGAQWFSILLALVEKNTRLIVYTKSACPILDVQKYYSRIGREYSECRVWRDAVLNDVEKYSPSVVIIGNAIENYSKKMWVDGLTSVLDRLIGSRVVVITPPPTLSSNPLTCLIRQEWLSQFYNISNMCSNIEADISKATEVYNWNKEAAAHYNNVSVLSLNDVVCPEGYCPAKVNGIVKFRDKQHLTNGYVASLVDVFLDRADIQ